MMKLPVTLAGCQACLKLLEPELKSMIDFKWKLTARIAELKQGSSTSNPARAASAKGGAVNSDTGEA